MSYRRSLVRLSSLALLSLALAVTVLPPTAALAASNTYLVNDTADSSGACVPAGIGAPYTCGSLRQALIEANGNAESLDTITFDMPGAAPYTIALLSALPAITDPVVLDGATDPAFLAENTPVIVLSGAGAGSPVFGLELRFGSEGSTIKGLVINGFSDSAIWIQGSDDNDVFQNFIGTDWTGTAAVPNNTTTTNRAAIEIQNSSGNQIGMVEEENLISGNAGRGVAIVGSPSGSNVVAHNTIGLDITGTTDLGNASDGVRIHDAGSFNAVTANVISGNASGVTVSDTSDTTITSNTIGTDGAQTTAIGNNVGIYLLAGQAFQDVTNTVISSNVIGGNGSFGGILLDNQLDATYTTSSTEITSNRIGVSSADLPIGNIGPGIAIGSGASAGGNSGNTIGGLGDENVIAYNGGVGVEIRTGTSEDNVGNAVLENSIHDNDGLGIDLAGDGVTPNDVDDVDAGPNDQVNRPVLSNFVDGGESDGTVDISLDAEPSQDYLIRIFSSSSCDPSGSGEGELPIDSIDLSTDGDGHFEQTGFYLTTGGLSFLTATTTDYNFNGSTSEFSQCLNLGSSGAPSDLALDVSPGTTNAGWAQLPEEQLSLEGASFEEGQLEASAGPTAAPLGKNPLGKNPLGKNPLGKNPLGKNPLGKNPLGKNPAGLNTTDPPLRTVAVSALVAHQLPDAPLLTDLPTTYPGGWSALLGTDDPEQSLSLNDVLTAGELGSITIPEIDWSATRFADLSPAAWLLGATPQSAITLPSGSWTSLRASMGPGCSSFTDSSTLLDLQWARCDLSVIPWNQIQLSDITNLSASPLGMYKLDGIVLALTPLGERPVADLGGLVGTCSTPCATIAEAQDVDAIAHSASVSDIPSAVLDQTTLGDLLPGMMDVTQYPYETLSLTQLIRSAILDEDTIASQSDSTVTYTASFTTTCPTGTLDVTLDLPNARFRTIPGSAKWTFDGGTPVAADDPGFQSETLDPQWTLAPGAFMELNGCSGPVEVTLSVDVIAGPDTGTFTSGLRVEADGFDAESIDDEASLEVVDGSETGNALASATPIVANTLYTGTIGGSNDTDYFTMPLPSATGNVAVYLSHLPADLDQVMYGPTSSSPALRSADLNLHPLGKNPIDDSGQCLPAGYVVNPQTLEDVPVVDGNTLAVRSFSTNRTDQDEATCTIGRETDSGNLTIQISGFNGDHSPHPYLLRVVAQGPQTNPPCAIASIANTGTPVATPTSIPSTTRTLFLVNADRLGDTHGATAEANVMAALNALAARSEVGGVVLPVENSTGVAAAYDSLNEAPCSTLRENNVVQAINAYVDSVVQNNNLTRLRFIVIVGADNLIPFARIPDLTQLGNQYEYTPDLRLNDVENPASRAAAEGYYLSDDPYGSFHPIPWNGDRLYLPDVSVGRLVETPAQIVDQITQYTDSNGILTPSSALVTGYDFTSDAADAVANALPTSTAVTRLIDPPTAGWNRAALLAGLDAAPRLINVNGHFDHFRTLTAGGDIATTQDFSGTAVPFGSLLFTLGCNSGASVPNAWITGTTPATLDWAEMLSQKRSSLLAPSGFGYGDDTTIAYSEELMRLFARNLNGTMSVGQAEAFAKAQYYGGLSAVSSYDLKAIQELVFYGLPMQRFGSAGVIADPTSPPSGPASGTATSDPDTGLDAVDLSLNPFIDPITDRHPTPDGDYFTGPNVQETQYRPLEPVRAFDVTYGNHRLHDALVTDLQVLGIAGFDPVFERPLIDQAGPEPIVDDVAFPTDYVATASANSVLGRRDYLVVNGGQYVSGRAVPQRIYTREAVRAFYSNSQDYSRPEFDSVGAADTGSTAFTVLMAPPPTPGDVVVQVYVMYVPDGSDTFVLKRLTNTAGNLWTGHVDDDVAEYFVQAVDSHGNVGLSTFKGLPSPVTASTAPGDVTVTITGGVGQSGEWYYDDASVDISKAGESFTASVDAGPEAAVPVTVTGEGAHVVEYHGDQGDDGVVVVPVDAAPPTVHFTVGQPRSGAAPFVGPTTPISAVVTDGASGVASCTKSGDGTPTTCAGGVNTYHVAGADGTKTITVNATDNVGHASGPQSLSVTLDGMPPSISCPSLGTIYLNGPYVVTAPASDGSGSGVDAANSQNVKTLDTSSVGQKTISFSAVDNVGNASLTINCPYRVVYRFTGFQQPIDSNVVNSANAGQTIPVKWRITDYFGTPITVASSFVSVTVSSSTSCGGTVDAIETYTSNPSGLLNLGNGYWQYNWQTPKSFKGQCRLMTLNLADGDPSHTARFQFK